MNPRRQPSVIHKEYTGKLKHVSGFLSCTTYTEIRCVKEGWSPHPMYSTEPRRSHGDVWYEWVKLTDEIIQEVFYKYHESYKDTYED